nr:zincin-like metallopeptidase domain-containing protein [Zophobihabitans entericus]
MMNNKKPFSDIVAEKIIQQLKEGAAPWQKPWTPGQNTLPMNPISGKRYKGINTLNLMTESSIKGYSDPRWLTYKQAASLGAQVRYGEQATAVQYWKFTELREQLDKDGKPVLDDEGKPVKLEVQLDKPKVFYAYVFNATQIDNMPPLPAREITWNPIERTESLLSGSGALFFHDQENKAFYSPVKDEIHLPLKSNFETADRYYATALHEFAHWTGATSRLNRDLAHPFGSEGYAKEELRAEIASMILGEELNIGHDPAQHVAYIDHWIRILENDPLEIFRAAADAEKIQNYVLSRELEINLQYEQDAKIENIVEYELSKDDKYSDLYRHLKKVAEEYDLKINVNYGEDCLYKIDYIGLDTPNYLITTEIYADGRASTCINDLIVPGEKPTSDIELSGKMLKEAITLAPGFEMNKRKRQHNLPAFTTIRADGDIKDTDRYVDAQEWYDRKKDPIFDLDRVKRNERYLIDKDDNRIMFESEINKRTQRTSSITYNNATNEYKLKEDELGEGTTIATKNIPLNIPFAEKETAKEIAGKLPDGLPAIQWDKTQKQWFARPGTDLDKLKPWLITVEVQQSKNLATERTILAIPYEQRAAVKQIAGKLENGQNAIEWDKENKVWIAKPGADLDKLKNWLPENVSSTSNALSPRQEFAEALESMGAILTGEHPIMDGQNHRIAVTGDANGAKAGFYKAFLDGHPAGYIKNNRTGSELKWKSKGYSLSDEEKAKLTAEAAIKLQERREQQERDYESSSVRVQNQLKNLLPVETLTPYLANKGIDVYPGLATDDKKSITYVPAYDVDGKQWTTQYIKEDGQKGFEKGSKKQGCFHVIGGQNELIKSPVIIISEGYATAASITKAAGFSTVAAFDSGNLKAVAMALHEKYPDKKIVIAGDDDRKLEESQNINPGRTKAVDAAKAVNGIAIFPIFAPEEEKTLTDFNDLAVKSSLGPEAIKRQIEGAIKNIKVEQIAKSNKQEKSKKNTLKL